MKKTGKARVDDLVDQLAAIPNYNAVQAETQPSSISTSQPEETVNTSGANPERDEWLRILHERYSERFLKDNDRIWTVTSIFIPLSLAGLSSLKDGSFMSIFLLGIGSIGLMRFWFIVCEKHRFFQEKSEDVVRAIEIRIGLDTSYPSSKPSIKQARIYMHWFIIILWVSAIGWAAYKEWHPNKPDPTTVIIHQWTTQGPLDFSPAWRYYPSVPIPFNPNYSPGKP
jgi:hypothetical protein